ncbi:hypothetical protein MATL_G00034560 [Megalops atlanticus]|uniref:Receptor-type tyrosine-protein phosphatase N2 n=1 Tax=Megalops atlanticus TaxID=7932 RepID=A0A9D3TD81_MEGAT|nr:hypothetical protein MATL_G00034560 [Megalops atlanticus]
MMDTLFSILFVLLASHTQLIATADRKFGCLFENGLCSAYEICINDGVFGRCQRVPVTDVYTYEVSPSALQRLRTLLQNLSLRGLSWQDDTTQQAVSKELSKLRRVFYRRPETSAADVTGKSRVVGGDRKLRPMEAELSRSLQKYFQAQGFLPRPAAQANTGPKGETSFNKALYHDVHPATEAFPQLPAKAPPPPAAAPSALSSSPPDKSRVLLAALEQYMGRKLPDKSTALVHPSGQPKGRIWYDTKWRPSLGTQVESVGKGRILLRPVAEVGKPQRPKTDRLLIKAGSNQPIAKDPLSAMDENFIQNVVKQLGRHSVNVDALNPKEVDQLADIIADALQVVDSGGVKGVQPREDQSEMKRGPPSTTSLEEDTASPEQVMEEEKPDSTDKNALFLSKLLEYLDNNTSTSAPQPDARVAESPAEADGAGVAPEEPSTDSGAVGVENVRSRTTQAEVAVEKKEAAAAEDSVEELSEVERWIHGADPPAVDAAVVEVPRRKDMHVEEVLRLNVQSLSTEEGPGDFGYIITDTDSLSTDEGLHLMELLARRAKLRMTDFLDISVQGPAVTFKVRPNPQNVSTADVTSMAVQKKDQLGREAGVRILEAGVSDKSKLNLQPTKYSQTESAKFLVLTVVSIVCIIGVLLGSGVLYCQRHRSHQKLKEKLSGLGTDTSTDATATYQELCRQRMAVRTSERPEPLHTSRISSVSSQFSDGPTPSPSARSSTSLWSEEPAQSNMDISTGHMILSYMEDHLKNKNRLEKEWEALCSYQAEPNACTIGQKDQNTKKNRSDTVVVYDHNRVTLKVENNHANSDYINASPIMDHDPRNPAYIATQGPLPSTVADFWQMVWENGCVVIVMLTPIAENGVKQSYHYWPDEGSNLYHIYEVNLVSEHIWCEDFLVRSFYLKNLQTNETRTVTQFHYLTWLDQTVPDSARTLLDFRRKVNKCYRGRSCPIIVHCSDGAGRSGTYILIDMVLNKMAKGAKEIDIAATLEHLRDQRPGMVQTKEQFEFALTAVAEEVNAILKALPQ